MGGGLMQLVAYGAQDIYLTGNPQITFFKVVYRRHTNFSMETIDQVINGQVSDGGSSTVTISRNGDLVYKVYVCSADGSGADGTITKAEIAVIDVPVDSKTGFRRVPTPTGNWFNNLRELHKKEVGKLPKKTDYIFQNIGTF